MAWDASMKTSDAMARLTVTTLVTKATVRTTVSTNFDFFECNGPTATNITYIKINSLNKVPNMFELDWNLFTSKPK